MQILQGHYMIFFQCIISLIGKSCASIFCTNHRIWFTLNIPLQNFSDIFFVYNRIIDNPHIILSWERERERHNSSWSDTFSMHSFANFIATIKYMYLRNKEKCIWSSELHVNVNKIRPCNKAVSHHNKLPRTWVHFSCAWNNFETWGQWIQKTFFKCSKSFWSRYRSFLDIWNHNTMWNRFPNWWFLILSWNVNALKLFRYD